MVIGGVFASEALDGTGEVLDVKGADISDFLEGRGVANYEHRGADEEKIPAAEVVGKVIHAHKVYDAKDCQNPLEKEAWERIEMPFIWGVVRLYDAAGHPGAINLAAAIRDAHANKEPVTIGFSIEGNTVLRTDEKDSNVSRPEGYILKRTMARRVAITFRPCNRTALFSLIADPKAPPGFDKLPGINGTLERAAKNDDPRFRRLGGYERDYNPEELEKALSAGGYNAAPSTLTGGAALQREHLDGKHLRNQVAAAFRDWDRRTPIKKFLKAYLPDVDEGFLDKFAGLAEQHAMKKAEELLYKKMGTKKPKAAPAPMAPEDDEEDGPPDDGKTPLTIHGVAQKPNPKLKKPHFDEKTGTLHTARGSFPMYIPGRDKPEHKASFDQAMNDPEATKFHDYALDHWMNLHGKFTEGKLPEEIPMHAVMFAQMSPNTPVPYQELMYGHMVDAMKHTGIDPRQENLDPLKEDWLKRDQPQNFPEHSPEHWKRLHAALRIKNNSKLTGRKEGDIGSFMLGPNKFKNVDKYSSFHKPLMELLQRHKGDARAAAEELLVHKRKSALHGAKRLREIKKGRPDIGPYKAGPAVAGLAPKTIRYMLGMIGGGNVQVPDTHFSRYLFGLDKEKDSKTIKYLRNQILWNDANAHVLNGIDKYYGANHDAVQHMMNHPKYGEYFKKHPEHAIFPAFWKNWMAIVPHERARGMATGGFNEFTDHKPYFEAVAPYAKSEKEGQLDMDDPLIQRTAEQHAEWAKKYGDMPAMMMYYKFLVPQLLEHAKQRTGEEEVEKIKKATEMLKAASDTENGMEAVKRIPAPNPLQTDDAREPVMFQGRAVQPGLILNTRPRKHGGISGDTQAYAVLGHTPTHWLAVSGAKVDPSKLGPNDLIKIPRPRLGTKDPQGWMTVHSYPKDVGASPVVDADTHGVGELNTRPASRALIHGLNLDPANGQPAFTDPDAATAQGRTSFWARNAQGKRVYVKGGEPDHTGFGTAKSEGAFYNLAHDVFGLGHYLPTTAVVRHPQTGNETAVIENVRNGRHWSRNDGEQQEQLERMHARGDTHRLAIMDNILGNTDRNQQNFMFTDDEPGMKLIDHGYAMRPSRGDLMPLPPYLHAEARQEPMHPETSRWLQSLSPANLEMHMRRHGVPDETINNAVFRLKQLQSRNMQQPGLPFSNFWGQAGIPRQLPPNSDNSNARILREQLQPTDQSVTVRS